MFQILYIFLALSIGVASSVQAPINALLAKSTGSSALFSAMVAFGIGFVCLIFVNFFLQNLNFANFELVFRQEFYKLSGGILGAFVVFAMALLAPKMGVSNMILCVILAQMLTGVVMDSFGVFELATKELSLQKILALFVVAFGVLLFFARDFKGL